MTERTPAERVSEFMAEVEERVVVTAHIHVSYDRRVDGVRLLSPGSVGMPYEDRPAAFWAVLGPDVEQRSTDYDLERTAELYRASGFPDVEEIVEVTLRPPTREEAITNAESLVFSG